MAEFWSIIVILTSLLWSLDLQCRCMCEQQVKKPHVQIRLPFKTPHFIITKVNDNINIDFTISGQWMYVVNWLLARIVWLTILFRTKTSRETRMIYVIILLELNIEYKMIIHCCMIWNGIYTYYSIPYHIIQQIYINLIYSQCDILGLPADVMNPASLCFFQMAVFMCNAE